MFFHDAGQARDEHIRDMAAEAVEVASVFLQKRASERVQQHAAEKGVPGFQEETVVEVRSGEAEVPEIIIVSDAVAGIFVDLDGYASVADRGENPEVVETIPQEHISDDLPVPQVVKENLGVIKVPQEREDVPQLSEETVEMVKLVSQERG